MKENKYTSLYNQKVKAYKKYKKRRASISRNLGYLVKGLHKKVQKKEGLTKIWRRTGCKIFLFIIHLNTILCDKVRIFILIILMTSIKLINLAT